MAQDWAPSKGCLEVIKAAGGIIVSPWIAVYGKLSPTPDRQIVFRDVGGRDAEVGLAIDYPSVQILVRGKDGTGGYEEGYAKMVAVRDALLAIPSAPVAYPELTSVTQIGHIQGLGSDDKDRPMWSLNLQLILSFTTSGHREV